MVATTVLSAVTLAVQAAFAFLFFSGIATGVTYLVKRSRATEGNFQMGPVDKALPIRARA